MSLGHGAKIVTNGLALCLDAANPKSFPRRPNSNEHGISDWIAMDSGTVTYSAVYPGTQVYEVDSSDNETLLITTGANPQRGTFSVTAGRRYYGTKPIHLIIKDGSSQHKMVPLSLSGTTFGYFCSRNTPGTIYFYSLYANATVNVYDDVVGGINGTATDTVSVSRGVVATFSVATTGWVIFTSDYPIVTSVTQNGVDRMILTPAATALYRAKNYSELTVVNTTPSTVGSYYVTDSTNLVIANEIADGAGGDAAMAIGLENISDTYSFGEQIPDFQIIAPYPNTVVNAYYWSGSAWVLGESFSLNGTLTNPAYVARDGDNGFGVAATNLTGNAVSLASGANLWKFEGNNPFVLYFNDTDDDEELMLGWMSNSIKRKGSNQNITLYDLSSNVNNGTLVNNINYDNNNLGSLLFNGSSNFITIPQTVLSSTGSSVSAWVYIDDFSTGKSSTGRTFIRGDTFRSMIAFYNGGYSFETDTNSNPHEISGRTSGNVLSSAITAGSWFHFTLVFNAGTFTGYVNGIQTGSAAISNNLTFDRIGDATGFSDVYPAFFKGSISALSIYNTVLSAAEVAQNYNALRGRYGL